MKILSFIACLLLGVSSAYGSSCVLERARVSQHWGEEGSKEEVWKIGNLDKAFYLKLRRNPLKPKFIAIRDMVKKSFEDKSLFMDIKASGMACHLLNQPELKTHYIHKYNFTEFTPSADEKYGCEECLQLYNTPMMFMLPTSKEMGILFSDVMKIPEEKADESVEKIIDHLEAMSPKELQGNSIVFPQLFFKVLYEAGLQGIDKEQMKGLKGLFADSMKGDEVELLNKIIGKIKSIDMVETANGLLVVKLNTPGKGIVLKKNDIPVTTPEQIAMLEQYFSSLEIANGATISYTAMSNGKVNVQMSGIRMIGKFPVVGPLAISDIKIQPEQLTYDPNRKIPTHVKVSFKKWIKLYKTFEFNY